MKTSKAKQGFWTSPEHWSSPAGCQHSVLDYLTTGKAGETIYQCARAGCTQQFTAHKLATNKGDAK